MSDRTHKQEVTKDEIQMHTAMAGAAVPLNLTPCAWPGKLHVTTN